MSLFRRIFNGWKIFLRQSSMVELVSQIQMKKWGTETREERWHDIQIECDVVHHDGAGEPCKCWNTWRGKSFEYHHFGASFSVHSSGESAVIPIINSGSITYHLSKAIPTLDTDPNDDNDITHRPSSPPRARLFRLWCHHLWLYPHRRARKSNVFVLSHEIYIRTLTRSNMW